MANNDKLGRRDFLRGLGVGAGIAATSTVATVTAAHADSESASEKTKSHYRETEHVKAYYRVNRYPKKS